MYHNVTNVNKTIIIYKSIKYKYKIFNHLSKLTNFNNNLKERATIKMTQLYTITKIKLIAMIMIKLIRRKNVKINGKLMKLIKMS